MSILEEMVDYYLGGDGLLEESINDKSIFKAVFLAGGPGSGKSFVAEKFFGGTGARLVNSDELLEYLLIKNNLPLKMNPDAPEWDAQQDQRAEAKRIVKNKKANYINGMLPLIIDGTGKDYEKIVKQAESLKDLGYDVHMIFVNTTLDVALERNTMRARSVPPSVVKSSWEAVQKNIGKFQNYFKSDFVVIDNSQKLDDAGVKELTLKMARLAKKWLGGRIKNQKGRATVDFLKKTKGKYLSDLPKDMVEFE